MTSTADEIEGPKRISDAVSRIFYPAPTKRILPWFGFFESSFHLAVYLISMAVLLFGVTLSLLNFDIYQEFDSKNKLFAVYCVVTPILLLSLSNMVSQLTFLHTGSVSEDKLLRFLMFNDGDIVVEQNAAQMREFRREFSSQLLKFRVSVGGFGLFLVSFKVIVDICRLSQHANPIYAIFIIAFWCYLYLSSVIANGLVYMAAIVCKLHVRIFKNSLDESGNSTATLFQHHLGLGSLLENFSHTFCWYFASQAMMCQIAGGFAFTLMFDAYMKGRGDFMLGALDYVCFLIVEIPFFWSIHRVLNDLSSENEIIRAAIVGRSDLLQLVSSNAVLISKWERVATYATHNSIGVHLFYPASRVGQMVVLFSGLLPLGVPIIAIIGKLTAYLP